MNKKKIIISSMVIVFLIIIGAAGLWNYKTNNLKTPFICSEVEDNGEFVNKVDSNPVEASKIYLLCKPNKFFVKNAVVKWYSDTDNNNPIKTEKVKLNDSGYFQSSISIQEGMKSGDYHVYIEAKNSSEVLNFSIK